MTRDRLMCVRVISTLILSRFLWLKLKMDYQTTYNTKMYVNKSYIYICNQAEKLSPSLQHSFFEISLRLYINTYNNNRIIKIKGFFGNSWYDLQLFYICIHFALTQPTFYEFHQKAVHKTVYNSGKTKNLLKFSIRTCTITMYQSLHKVLKFLMHFYILSRWKNLLLFTLVSLLYFGWACLIAFCIILFAQFFSTKPMGFLFFLPSILLPLKWWVVGCVFVNS
jgi:hypothetical protein